jgi:IPT/TIG domain
MKTGCTESQFAPDIQTDDRIYLLKMGKYYGHPNPLRAAVDNDPRQCIFRGPTDVTTDSFEGPLATLFSSADGIIEYEADHFDRQLRHNLIVSRYKNGLFRVILAPNGLSIIPESIPPIPIVGNSGLDLTQAPNGNLIEVRLLTSSLFVHAPKETATTALQIAAVWPRRGGQAGGNKLAIYGRNLGTITSSTVSVGGKNCPIVTAAVTSIVCTLPGGTAGSTVSVIVTGVAGTYIFERGYRYIAGVR